MISYAITDPSIFDFSTIDEDLKRIASKANMILYRDKSTPSYPTNARVFLHNARKYPFDTILLHGDIDLAIELQADGLHLTSKQLSLIPLAKESGLFTIASTHNEGEALKAQELGADAITYSPIFPSPNKGIPLTVKAIGELKRVISIPIIALGGILTQNQIDEVMEQGAAGFASIRYFG